MNSRASEIKRPSGVVPWKSCFVVTLATLVFQLWLFRPLVVDYFPTLDEIALQAASTEIGGPVNPALWFTQGLHDYFTPYPEWPQLGTELWRPLVNTYYWLFYQSFGSHWSEQLIVGYLSHALVVGLVCYIALSVFGLSPLLAFLAVTIAIFNPAYIYQDAVRDPFQIPRAAQFPIYQIEVIDALLMIGAFLAFVRRRYWLFGLLATVAVLLKETALALPVSALALTGAWLDVDRRRSLRNFAWLTLPLGAWLIGRLAIFKYGWAIYGLTSNDLTGWFIHLLRHMLLWPTGLYQSPLGVTRSAVAAHDWKTLISHGYELAINLAWWAALAIAIVYVYKGYKTCGHRWLTKVPEPWLVGLLFALGNLVFVVCLMSTEVRYGYLWFALGPPAIFAVLSRWRGGATITLALALGLVVPQLRSLASSFSGSSINDYRMAKQSAKQLTSLLGKLPSSVNTVYLIDDLVVQSSSPQYFAKFAGFRGQLILVNNLAPISGCRSLPRATQRYRLSSDGTTTTLQYNAPECFQRAWNVAPLNLFDSKDYIQRGEWMTYHFPDLSIPRRSFLTNNVDYEAGRRWELRSNNPSCAQRGACVWLGLDPIGRRYYALNFQ